MKKYFLCSIVLLCYVANVFAQDDYNDRVKKYIDQYSTLAIAEQRNSGIPASVTLGQGILETEAGTSELMTTANNHFGIKCKNGWTGDTFLHTDDAPDECFKKYTCAAESYRDHSLHLKRNPRYAPLFTLSQTDYASWAVGLKKCGYATNPQYAQKLIKIIEDFRLQEYTYSALDSSLQKNYPAISSLANATTLSASKKVSPIAVIVPIRTETNKILIADTIKKKPATTALSLKNIADSVKKLVVTENMIPKVKTDTVKKIVSEVQRWGDSKYDSGTVILVNGLRAFYALKGEMLLQYAVKYNVRYPKLLELNDLTDAPLPFSMYIYLEKKLSSGTHAKHTVTEGETLLMVAQEESIQMKRLMALNYLSPNQEPAIGGVLELQTVAARKPDIRQYHIPAHIKSLQATVQDTLLKPDNDYIALRKPAVDTEIEQTTPGSTTPGYVQYVAGSDYKGNIDNTQAVVQDTAKAEDLTGLKAELDKVVYTDDSKLPQTKNSESKTVKLSEKGSVYDSKKEGKLYKVKKGDTAFSIAKKNNITIRQLLKWNEIDANEVRTGQNLKVKE